MSDAGLASEKREALTVTQLNTLVHDVFESIGLFSGIAVRGEISNLVKHRSGHFYFSLKDEGSLLRALMFRGDTLRLSFEPENGMSVILYGTLGAYVKDGSYRFIAKRILPDGAGALHMAFEQLKRRLAAEGLFDPARKKPIPKIPRRIGVVTSPTGAAVRDLIQILGRRFPMASVTLFPALVQGEDAPESLIEGIQTFERLGSVDLIIIGRGGGSAEDLWAFNDENLARRIAACRIPVISAVGHETDFTICDFVADLRAPTPSAAAELAVPETEALKQRFQNVTDKLYSIYRMRADALKKRLALCTERPFMKDPLVHLLRRPQESLAYARLALSRAVDATLTEKKNTLGCMAASLEALSPLGVLSRGYAIPSRKGKVIRGKDDLAVGETFTLTMIDGEISAVKTEMKENLK